MTAYLLDTSILSVFAPGRPPLSPPLQDWIATQRLAGSWHLSTIVAEEVQKGVSKLARTGAAARAQRLDAWLGETLREFGSRVLPVSSEIAREAGRLEDAAIALGRDPGLADALIAATARTHNLSILTANIRHFAVLDVPYLNPLDGFSSHLDR